MAAVRDCGFEMIDHPPYYTHLALSDYYLFPQMKGKHLVDNQYRSEVMTHPLLMTGLVNGMESLMEEVCGPRGGYVEN